MHTVLRLKTQPVFTFSFSKFSQFYATIILAIQGGVFHFGPNVLTACGFSADLLLPRARAHVLTDKGCLESTCKNVKREMFSVNLFFQRKQKL